MASNTTEIIHHSASAATHYVGEHAVHLAADTGGAAASIGPAAGFGAVFTSVGIGLAAVASTVINVVKYRNKLSDLCDIYRDEIAAKLGKSPSQATTKDLNTLAQGAPELGIPANQTIAEELDKLKKDRNLGIGVTMVSILCAIPLALAIMSALPALTGIAGFLTKVAVGFTCHKLIEYPIDAAGEKLFHMEGNSTHERIEDLVREREAGMALSKEQVLGVFISANKQLSEFVKQNSDKEYDDLPLQAKQSIVQSFEQFIPLTQITESLNSGRVKITELAFSAVGQQSGVKPSETPIAPKTNVIGKARGALYDVASHLKLRPAQQHLNHEHPMPKAQPQVASAPEPAPVRPPRKEMYYEQNERSDGKSWASVVRPQRSNQQNLQNGQPATGFSL